VTLHTSRGQFQTTVEYPRGNPENPLSDAELVAKFDSLVTPIVGRASSEELRAVILDLSQAKNVTLLTRLLAF
jgi:2-methylcitrate dehydratase PrpD